MKRRDFIRTVTAATVSTTALASTHSLAQTETSVPKSARKFVELRLYTPLPDMMGTLVKLIDTAILPALNRQSIKPVGAFTWHEEIIEKNDVAFRDKLFLLIQHDSPESFIDLDDRLLRDDTFAKDSSALLDPLPLRQICAERESSLLHCFPSCPKIEIPSAAAGRFVQLRRYKSRNQDRNAKKIKMFDVRGELNLFRRCQMPPVFFGETLFGTLMPNLTYMLMFESDEARKKAWSTFVQHPEWKEMKSEPEYEEAGLHITNIFLKPTPGSQI